MRSTSGLSAFRAGIWLALLILAGGCGRKQRIRAPAPAPPVSKKAETPAPQPVPPSRPSERPTADDRPVPRPREVLPPRPAPPESRVSIRVALETERSAVTIPGLEGAQILFGESSRTVSGTANISIPLSNTVTQKFWVQVAAPTREDDATKLLAEYKSRGFSGKAAWNERLQRFQVRLGPYSTRAGADAARRGTAADAFVASETVSQSETATLEIGRERWQSGRFEIRAGREDFLRYRNRRYRGSIEIFVSRNGSLSVVNRLDLEDYVRGVVPNELSPYLFPHLEALKAQAVAARTYAFRNRGQFAADGFDLFATVRSQVYGGLDSERELSTRAVLETAGLVATYHGEVIEAVYSSTCGGHTEDSSNVFSSRDVPYLKGVVCTGEQALNEGEGLTLPAEDELDFELGLVNSTGIDLLSQDGQFFSQRITSVEMQRWTTRVAALLQKQVAPPADFAVENFFRWLSLASGAGRAEARFTPRDASLALQEFEDLDLIDLALRPDVAWLVEKKILEPEGRRLIPPLPLRRGYVLHALGRLMAGFGDELITSGRVERAREGALEINTGRSQVFFALSPSLLLYRREPSGLAPQHNLTLRGGEQVRYVSVRGSLQILILESGAGDTGKLAPSAHWEFRVSSAEVSLRVRGLVRVGAIREIAPVTFGVSGRVLKIRLAGAAGEGIVSGAQFKGALGLRDTLFTVERRTSPQGATEFLFRGRGWGHGVGLCQIGTVGLARQGKSFEEILKTYYTGIELKPLAALVKK